MKEYHFRRLGLAILFTVTLIFMMPQSGFCNGFEGGPPAGYNFFGPAILGELIITPSAELVPGDACSDDDPGTPCDMYVVFRNASCRGTSIPLLEGNGFLTDHDFADLEAENFEGYLFNQALFPDIPDKCWPQSNSSQSPAPYDNVINTITQFENSGTEIYAEVIILFVVQE